MARILVVLAAIISRVKTSFLDFEQPIAELEQKIEELRFVQDDSAVDISQEIERLSKKSRDLTKDIYGKLSAWQISKVARHPQRPYTLDYINEIFTDFVELHGDRHFADDLSIVGGLARFNGQACMVIGHQKGRDTKERMWRNYGMARPEGYRKALRLMRLAEKFGLPLVTLIDTAGAYPGIGAEERGQSEAIARNLFTMSSLAVPIVTVVTGEGGSGGALAIGVADRVLMLQYSIYSVISPEGCASRSSSDSFLSSASVLKIAALTESAVTCGSRCAPPSGSVITSSTRPRPRSRVAVIPIASAASSAFSALFQRMLAQPSGEITE